MFSHTLSALISKSSGLWPSAVALPLIAISEEFGIQEGISFPSPRKPVVRAASPSLG